MVEMEVVRDALLGVGVVDMVDECDYEESLG